MAQMRALDTPDPFNDDFYYHNAMRRKQEKSRRDIMMGGDPHVRVRPDGAGIIMMGQGRTCRRKVDNGDPGWTLLFL